MKNRIFGILVVLMVMLGTINLRAEECTFQTEIALDMNKYPPGFKGVVDIVGNKILLDVGPNGARGVSENYSYSLGKTYMWGSGIISDDLNKPYTLSIMEFKK